VVEYSFRIPGQLKLSGSVEKYLLKRAVEDLLPQAILDRPKSGMLVPVEGWFRGPLAAAARERLLDRYPLTELVRRDYLQNLLDGKLGGLRPRHGAKVWLLLTLESWLHGHRPSASVAR
jgi:asparagine synthase (glutamine-hydrolysing)